MAIVWGVAILVLVPALPWVIRMLLHRPLTKAEKDAWTRGQIDRDTIMRDRVARIGRKCG